METGFSMEVSYYYWYEDELFRNRVTNELYLVLNDNVCSIRRYERV